MRILIACEESQRVCTAFRNRGHEAYSCDLLPCSGGHPEWHIMCDVLDVLTSSTNFDWNDTIEFETMDGKYHVIDENWDMLIAHPPCTFLTNAANKLYSIERYGVHAVRRWLSRYDAAEFFMALWNAPIKRVAVENPIGYMSTYFRKPDQIIQPYQFGHPVRKSTCLWLRDLPPLIPTCIVEPELIHSKGASGGYSGPSWVVRDENGKILKYNDPRVSVIRSKTYPGIADAMANQWG